MATTTTTTPNEPVQTITTTAEYNDLLKKHKYVVVDFHASWCGPCKAIAPLFQQHASQHAATGHVGFAKLDIDEVPDVAARYRVTSIPYFLFVKDGEEYDEVRGASPPKLKAAVDEIAAELAKEGGSSNDVTKAIQDEDW